MPVIVVDDVSSLASFYVNKLGFEQGLSVASDEGAAFVVFSYGSSNVGLAEPGSIPDLPAPHHGPMIVIDVMDVAGIHQVMSARAADAVGELKEAFFGQYFDVKDPAGNTYRFLEKSEAIRYDPAARTS